MIRRIFERLSGAALVDLVHMPANGLTHKDADEGPGDGGNCSILAMGDLRARRASDGTAEDVTMIALRASPQEIIWTSRC